MTDIINASLSQCKVPTQWKEANVIPIPKLTPPSIDKLRLVSLTCTLAKVAESRVCKWITDHIQPRIDNRQYGNQKGVSTTHCFIDIYRHIISGAEKGANISTRVLTDFSKAFDLIDHKIAVTKWSGMNTPPVLFQWVVDFLTNRKQRVIHKNVLSDWIGLSGGVPHGTITGPLTFLCMINDALSNRDHQVWKYVDDLTIWKDLVRVTTCSLQPRLDSLSSWSQENKLKLNPTKCQAMRVYLGNKEIPDDDLFIAYQQLAVVDKVKLLCVIIRDDLKWNGQVENMCTKDNQKFFMLRKLKEAGFSCQELVTIYKGYMRPVLEYAAPFWHPGRTQKQVDQVENIQKRVCRHILGWEYTSYPDSLAELELESLDDRRLHICREFAVKCSTSGKFSRWFPPSEYRSIMTLRKQRKFEFLKHKTNRFRDSPIPFMINLLNK